MLRYRYRPAAVQPEMVDGKGRYRLLVVQCEVFFITSLNDQTTADTSLSLMKKEKVHILEHLAHEDIPNAMHSCHSPKKKTITGVYSRVPGRSRFILRRRPK